MIWGGVGAPWAVAVGVAVTAVAVGVGLEPVAVGVAVGVALASGVAAVAVAVGVGLGASVAVGVAVAGSRGRLWVVSVCRRGGCRPEWPPSGRARGWTVADVKFRSGSPRRPRDRASCGAGVDPRRVPVG